MHAFIECLRTGGVEGMTGAMHHGKVRQEQGVGI